MSNQSSQRSLVLFSGGQDSTTCLYWAKDNFRSVIALNINYGQRHNQEIISANTIARMAGVELIHLDFPTLKNIADSALLNKGGNVSSKHRASKDLPASFVPGRNILFLTIAAAYAYKRNISSIVTGVCQTDFSGYPDCRDNTIKSLQVTLSLGMDYPFIIETPLMWLSKAQIVLLAKELGEDCWEALGWSHTCYEGKVPPCGICPACQLRIKGFMEAGLSDPLIDRTYHEQ